MFPRWAWFKDSVVYNDNDDMTNNLCFRMNDQKVNFMDWKNISIVYDRLLADEVRKMLSTLDFSKVKLEQQDQFFKGLRMVKTSPEVALQICLDAYDFDGWEFDWSNPVSYFNVVKEVVGLVGAVKGLK